MNFAFRYLLLIFIAALAAGIIIPKGFTHDSVTVTDEYRTCAKNGVQSLLSNPFEKILLSLTGRTVIAGIAEQGSSRTVVKTETYAFYGSHYASTLISCIRNEQGQIEGGSVSTIRWWHDGNITTQKY